MQSSTLPQFDDLGFERARPVPALRNYVTWFWSIQAVSGTYSPRREFMHANGSTGVIFNWDDNMELSKGRYNKGVNIDPPAFQSQSASVSGTISSFGILFKPGAAFSVFSTPGYEIKNIESLAAREASQFRSLFDELGECKSFLQRVRKCEKFLFNRLASTPQVLPQQIKCGLQEINRSRGLISLAQLESRLNLSGRQIERLFKQHIGLTPNQYMRITRVNHARTLIKQHATNSLAEIALMAGYYDQSHFNREFGRIIGITPGTYQTIKRSV